MAKTRITEALCLLRDGPGWSQARRTLVLSGSRIQGPAACEAEPEAGETVVPGEGLLAIPGLVNAHYHSPDTLIRGSAPMLPLELWSLHSAAGRERRTPRESYVAAMLGAIEMLRSGTTTVLDHIRISPDIDGDCLDAAAKAYRDIGIRAIVAPIVADRRVADTLPLCSDDLGAIDIGAYGLREPLPSGEQIAIAEAFLERLEGACPRVSGAIGPSAPQRCTDKLLDLCADLSARRKVLLHMHLLETRSQSVLGHDRYGRGTVAHLYVRGLLGQRTNLAHAIWIEAGDLDRIAASGAAIIHNPVSNARLGSGLCPIHSYLARGIPVGLGTDSCCCNDGSSLLETAKWAALAQNSPGNDPDTWVGPGTALHLATAGGAAALGLGAVTGRLEAGFAADITLLRLASPAFVPLFDPVRQLVLSETGTAVERVIVAGETVFAEGHCTLIDEAAIWSEAQELADRRLRDNAGEYRAAAALSGPIRRMYARLDREAAGTGR